MDYSDYAKESEAAAEWLSAFAPEPFKLLARRIRLGADDDSPTAKKILIRMGRLLETTHIEASKDLLMMIGLRGEELERTIDNLRAIHLDQKILMLKLRARRR